MNLQTMPGYTGASGYGGMMFSEYPTSSQSGWASQWDGKQLPWDVILNGFNPKSNNTSSANKGMYGDPFGTAMSGTKSGTLQPYINRMTQNASNALYGGLLGYKPQSLIAGDAGGTPQNSAVPQFNMPSSLGQGLNFTGFGNRSWMKGGQ